jgi:hypothetical protein
VRIGYRPNRTAQHVQSGRHGSVGLLVGDLAFIRPQELQFMIEAAHERDWLLVIEQVNPAGPPPKLIREDCVDGLLLFQTMGSAQGREIKQAHLPLVQINTNTRRGPGCITDDEEAGMRRAVRLLAARRRTHPALIVGDHVPTHYSDRVRQPTEEPAHERLLAFSPGRSTNDMVWFERAKMPAGVTALCLAQPTGYVTEIAVPLALLGKPGRTFRLNVTVNDFDRRAGPRTAYWWRPAWYTREDYRGSGTFRLAK